MGNEFYQCSTSAPVFCMPFIDVGTHASTPGATTPVDQLATPHLSADVFDDPFEPPPEARMWKFQESAIMARFRSSTMSDITTEIGSERNYGMSSYSSSCGT